MCKLSHFRNRRRLRNNQMMSIQKSRFTSVTIKKGTWFRLEKTCLLSNVQTETLRNDLKRYWLPKIALKPQPALQGSTDKHDSWYHLSIPQFKHAAKWSSNEWLLSLHISTIKMTDLKALRCDGRRCSLSTEAWRVVSNTKAPENNNF